MVDANLDKPSEILDLKVTMDKAKVGNDLHLDNVILTSLIKRGSYYAYYKMAF